MKKVDKETADYWTELFRQAGGTIIYETEDGVRFVNERKDLDITIDKSMLPDLEGIPDDED